MIFMCLIYLKKLIYIIFIIYLINKTVNSQQIQNINVLFINEPDNHPASKAIEVVEKYIKTNSKYGLRLNIYKIELNKSNAESCMDSICKKYDQSIENKQPPHIVLDTTKSGLTSQTVKLFTRSLGLPTFSVAYEQHADHLKYWNKFKKNEKSYLLQIIPPTDVIPILVKEFIRENYLFDVAILYDETFFINQKQKFLLRHIETRHVVSAIADERKSRIDQIERLIKLNINHFFILGTLKSISQVLESVKPKYFDHNFVWYAVSHQEGTLNVKPNNASIIFVQPVISPEHRERFNMLRYEYNLNDQIQIMAFFYFDLALTSILTIRNIMRSGNWSADMEYIKCADYENNNIPLRYIHLYDYFKEVTEPTTYGDFQYHSFRSHIYNFRNYYTMQININLLQIEEGNVINSKPIRTMWNGPFTLNKHANDEDNKCYKANTLYRIFTVVQAPFVIRDDTAPNGYKGYCIDLINEIADILQFNYTIQEVEDGKFGNMNEKGEWNGVIRKLIDKEADIGLGSLSVMSEREMVVDFTVPYYGLVGITIMMHKANNTRSSSMFKFITVLESNVWLCILGAYLFTTFLIWLFERLSPFSYQNNREKYQDNVDQIRVFTFKECLWFSITSLTSQGGGEVPKNISGHLLAAFWWLFGFIIIASYTANLSAFLTVSDINIPVESLDDLSKQYKIDYAPLNDSMVMAYFQRMANVEQMFHKIWKNMILNDSLTHLHRSKLAVWDYPISDKYNKMLNTMHKTKLPNNLEEAVSRVRNSTGVRGFAFLGDATDIRYLVMTNCDLQIIGEEFSLKPYAIAVQMGSHLKDKFNNA
ncbi:ionotropic receptor 25a-like isoform 2-T2 [Cochliomyia hominivorax]